MEPCILAGSRAGDLVLDPFMGSGTTAVIALRHAFNSAATILKAMHEAERRMDPRK